LENKLKDKPYLQRAIETQGIHKVALVAQIATSQTDAFFADKVENMSKPALQQLSKEIRMEEQNWPKEEKSGVKIELDNGMEFLFLKLKNKLGKNLSNKEALRRMLQILEQNILQSTSKTKTKNQNNTKSSILSKNPRGKFDEKGQNITKQQSGNLPTNKTICARSEPKSKKIPGKISRYIPVAVKKITIAKTNGKCAHEGCNKPYEILHHINRFALNKYNESAHENVIPLCKEHHEFAHNSLLKEDLQNGDAIVEGKSLGNASVDKKYKECRRQTLMI